jgi:PKD repeat protein
VISDGASNFWPLSETAGTAGYDLAGGNDLILGTGVTRNVAGPASAGTAAASGFDGTANSITTSKANGERRVSFSVEAWVRTTSTTGGEIVGYGLSNAQNSVNTDRTLYLAPNGQPYFGVWQDNLNNTVNGATAINDGAWHHLVGSVAPGGGMSLYVDGSLAASQPSIASTSVLSGYWRVGGDGLSGWPSVPTGLFALNGSIADVAVYPTPLTFSQIVQHYGGAVPNQAPTAVISATGVNLNLNFTGSPSTDPDGTITSYAWTFGDGATATGQAVSHSYATGGTYTVTLTVTDNDGATDTATTVVTPGQVTYANDTFQRTVSSDWGTADSGGPWTRTGTASNFNVAPGAGTILLAAGVNPGSVYLGGLSVQDVELATRFSLGTLANGNGTSFYAVSRRISSTMQYRARVRVTGTGSVLVGLSKFEGAGEVNIAETTVSGLTYTAGTPLQMRFQTTGVSPTTLRVKVWPTGESEPASWQLTSTDSSASLQAAGPFGFTGYLSSSSTNGPVTLSVSDFRATEAP